MLTRERYLSSSAGPGKSDDSAVRPTNPPDFDETSFAVALFHMVDKLVQDEQKPTEQELQAQGDATIARIMELFEGVDITTPAPKENPRFSKKDEIDVVVFDFPFIGARVARAIIEGNFKLAEIRTYDKAIGMHPAHKSYPPSKPEVIYELHGFVGFLNVPVDTYVVQYKSGKRLTTDWDYMNPVMRMTVQHRIGDPYTPPTPWNERDHLIPYLDRKIEVSALKQLGVLLRPLSPTT